MKVVFLCVAMLACAFAQDAVVEMITCPFCCVGDKDAPVGSTEYGDYESACVFPKFQTLCTEADVNDRNQVCTVEEATIESGCFGYACSSAEETCCQNGYENDFPTFECCAAGVQCVDAVAQRMFSTSGPFKVCEAPVVDPVSEPTDPVVDPVVSENEQGCPGTQSCCTSSDVVQAGDVADQDEQAAIAKALCQEKPETYCCPADSFCSSINGNTFDKTNIRCCATGTKSASFGTAKTFFTTVGFVDVVKPEGSDFEENQCKVDYVAPVVVDPVVITDPVSVDPVVSTGENTVLQQWLRIWIIRYVLGMW